MTFSGKRLVMNKIYALKYKYYNKICKKVLNFGITFNIIIMQR